MEELLIDISIGDVQNLLMRLDFIQLKIKKLQERQRHEIQLRQLDIPLQEGFHEQDVPYPGQPKKSNTPEQPLSPTNAPKSPQLGRNSQKQAGLLLPNLKGGLHFVSPPNSATTSPTPTRESE